MREMTEGHVDDETKLVIEWAPFRLASGATEASLLEASESLQREFLDRCAGFLRRELLCGTDGQWADLVYWSDEASAQAAARATTASSRAWISGCWLQRPTWGWAPRGMRASAARCRC